MMSAPMPSVAEIIAGVCDECGLGVDQVLTHGRDARCGTWRTAAPTGTAAPPVAASSGTRPGTAAPKTASSGTRNIVLEARKEAARRMRAWRGMSYPQIARALGYRSHAAIVGWGKQQSSKAAKQQMKA